MRLKNLRLSLAAGVVAVAAFNTLAALSMPRVDMRVTPAWIALWLVLLLTHAAVYWYADALRPRLRDAGYLALQAAIIFTIMATRAPFPVGVGLCIALTVFAVILVGERWGAFQITFGAIVLFAISAIMTSNLYRGATAGLLLAVAGLVGHALSALVRRETPPKPPASAASPQDVSASGGAPGTLSGYGLTAREVEVLQALLRGARNSEIASQLGIAERTVKAHLASVYAKLGVDSRGAAIALASRQGLMAERAPQ